MKNHNYVFSLITESMKNHNYVLSLIFLTFRKKSEIFRIFGGTEKIIVHSFDVENPYLSIGGEIGAI